MGWFWDNRGARSRDQPQLMEQGPRWGRKHQGSMWTRLPKAALSAWGALLAEPNRKPVTAGVVPRVLASISSDRRLGWS